MEAETPLVLLALVVQEAEEPQEQAQWQAHLVMTTKAAGAVVAFLGLNLWVDTLVVLA